MSEMRAQSGLAVYSLHPQATHLIFIFTLTTCRTMDIVPYTPLRQTSHFSAYRLVVPLTFLLLSGGEHKKMKAEKGEEEE
jgi:hypothetical protein